MMENAIYSILSPEGFASILWKDSKKAEVASRVMKITAHELKELKVIDRIIPEKKPACLETLPRLTLLLDNAIEGFLAHWCSLSAEELVQQRYDRFR